jgi:hypothetical protein
MFMALSAFYKEPAAYLAALLVDDAEVTIARAYFHADAKGKAHILNAAKITLIPDAELADEERGQTVERSEFFESRPEKKVGKKKAKPKTANTRGGR